MPGCVFKIRIPYGSYIPSTDPFRGATRNGSSLPRNVFSSKLQIGNSCATKRESLPLFGDSIRCHELLASIHLISQPQPLGSAMTGCCSKLALFSCGPPVPTSWACHSSFGVYAARGRRNTSEIHHSQHVRFDNQASR